MRYRLRTILVVTALLAGVAAAGNYWLTWARRTAQEYAEHDVRQMRWHRDAIVGTTVVGKSRSLSDMIYGRQEFEVKVDLGPGAGGEVVLIVERGAVVNWFQTLH